MIENADDIGILRQFQIVKRLIVITAWEKMQQK